jgi:hypothetical protein
LFGRERREYEDEGLIKAFCTFPLDLIFASGFAAGFWFPHPVYLHNVEAK